MESIGLLTPPAHRISISRSTFWRRPELKKLEPLASGAFMARSTSLCRMRRRERDRFDARQVELRRRMVDVEPDHIAVRVQIDHQAIGYFAGFHAGRVFQLDIEAVRLRIIVKLHGWASRKLRSK